MPGIVVILCPRFGEVIILNIQTAQNKFTIKCLAFLLNKKDIEIHLCKAGHMHIMERFSLFFSS